MNRHKRRELISTEDMAKEYSTRSALHIQVKLELALHAQPRPQRALIWNYSPFWTPLTTLSAVGNGFHIITCIFTPAPVFLLRTTHKKHNLMSLLTFLRMEQSLFQVCKTNLLRREQSQVLVYSNINFLGARKAWRMACSLKVLFPPIEQLGFRWNASESNEMRN